jgi:hypothetical protein
VDTSLNSGTHAIRADGTLWTWQPTRGRTQVGTSASWTQVTTGGGAFVVALSSRLLIP